jgi:hypothetical protein
MLSVSDEQVDKLLKALDPHTRRTIAMWPQKRRGKSERTWVNLGEAPGRREPTPAAQGKLLNPWEAAKLQGTQADRKLDLPYDENDEKKHNSLPVQAQSGPSASNLVDGAGVSTSRNTHAGALNPKREVKRDQVYGAELNQWRTDAMEARKRTYELTSEIAAERSENAKLREMLREEKSKARTAERAYKKSIDDLQRQLDQFMLDSKAVEAKAAAQLVHAGMPAQFQLQDMEQSVYGSQRQTALDAGTIDALRHQVKKLLTQVEESERKQHLLREETMTAQQRLRAGTRVTTALQEDVQRLEAEHAACLKNLARTQSELKQLKDAQVGSSSEASERKMREQEALIERLQGELFYLGSQNKEAGLAEYASDYSFTPGMNAASAAVTATRNALETKIRKMEEVHSRLLEQAQRVGRDALEAHQVAESKWQAKEMVWRRREQDLEQQLAAYGGSRAPDKGQNQNAVSGKDPGPGDVVLEMAFASTPQLMPAEEFSAFKHSLVALVSDAIGARSGSVRVLGAESTSRAPTVLHLLLDQDACLPAASALAAGNDLKRQAEEPNSLLRADPRIGKHLLDVHVRLRNSSSSPEEYNNLFGAGPGGKHANNGPLRPPGFVRELRPAARGSIPEAEDLSHCGSAKCSAMIHSLNQQLEDALFELSQTHQEMAHNAKTEERRMQEYKDQLNRLCDEAVTRRDTYEHGSSVISAHDAAIQHAQAQLHEALGRLQRRENEEKLRLSVLVGEIEHLKMDKLARQRVEGDRDALQCDNQQLRSQIANLRTELEVSSKSRLSELQRQRAEQAVREAEVQRLRAQLNQPVVEYDQLLATASGQGKRGGVDVELELDMDFRTIEGEQAGPFRAAVLQDVANAVGGDKTKMRIKDLQPGSIRVLLEVDEGVCGPGVDALEVAKDIEKQATDHNSRLKQGRYTSATKGVKFSARKMPRAESPVTPAGPASERDRVAALEADLLEARAASRVAALEQARLQSRLQLAEDECKIMSQRVQAAKASLADQEKLHTTVDAMMENGERMQGETTKRALEAEKALQHSQADTKRAKDELALAKVIAQERELAFDELCKERDNLHSQLQSALQAKHSAEQEARASQHARDYSTEELSGTSPTREVTIPSQAALTADCRSCETLIKDNKQLFQDNQKLFRDNKKLVSDNHGLKAEVDMSKERALQLEIEVDALKHVNADLVVSSPSRLSPVGSKTPVSEMQTESIENARLKHEVEAHRRELEQLQTVQELNRTLAEKLDKLSDEYKRERERLMDSNRTLSAEVAELALGTARVNQQLVGLTAEKAHIELELERMREEGQHVKGAKTVEYDKMRASSSSVMSTDSQQAEKLLADNKKMFSDCQRFVAELQHLNELNNQLVQDNHNLINDMQKVTIQADSSATQLAKANATAEQMLKDLRRISLELRKLERDLEQANERYLQFEAQMPVDEQRQLLEQKLRAERDMVDELQDNQKALVREMNTMQQASEKDDLDAQSEVVRLEDELLRVNDNNQRMFEDNSRLVADNKKMFADCQRFVREIQELKAQLPTGASAANTTASAEDQSADTHHKAQIEEPLLKILAQREASQSPRRTHTREELLQDVQECVENERSLREEVKALRADNAFLTKSNKNLIDQRAEMLSTRSRPASMAFGSYESDVFTEMADPEAQERAENRLSARGVMLPQRPVSGLEARSPTSSHLSLRGSSISPTSTTDPVVVELVLDMDFDELARKDISQFKQAVARDIADAVAGDPTKVRVMDLQPGSVRMLTALDEGVCGPGVDALEVAKDIEKQATDPNSRLKQGRYTKLTSGVKVVGRKVASRTASHASDSHRFDQVMELMHTIERLEDEKAQFEDEKAHFRDELHTVLHDLDQVVADNQLLMQGEEVVLLHRGDCARLIVIDSTPCVARACVSRH